MEKKGEIITQLALISELIENVNMEYTSAIITFNVDDVEFKRIYDYTLAKNGEKHIPLKNDMKKFTINIGNTNIVIISKNNV